MGRKLQIPVGKTDYKSISQNNYYIDKTMLIKDILDEAENAEVILFTRPRRFGKTLNMSMLQAFFEKTDKDTSIYFKDKAIWTQGDAYTEKQGKYPVIALTLKDIKADAWNTAYELLKYIIINEYSRHSELQRSNRLTESDLKMYNQIVQGEATEAVLMFSLQALSRMLHAHYGNAPIIIIDEYDTPIQEGYINGYYDKAIGFIRNFFSAALKDNTHMTFSVLTGILKVAKESIFSGLNNVNAYSVLDGKYSNYFGFTDEEVQALAEYYGADAKLAEIKEWYDGYRFGDVEIYNPWSVANYFNRNYEAKPYWVETSENTIIHKLLQKANGSIYTNLHSLLEGKSVESIIKTNIIYPNLDEPQTNIYGFLLMTGYLKSTEVVSTERTSYICRLKIPNKEIQGIYWDEVMRILEDNIGEEIIWDIQAAILKKDREQLKEALSKFLLKTVSFFDGLKENYYHGLMLGLMAVFSRGYELKSNRESGNGRYDIQLMPKNKANPGIIIELKAVNRVSNEELYCVAKSALEQIEIKKYDTELLSQGITQTYKYGIAFCQKQVEVVTN